MEIDPKEVEQIVTVSVVSTEHSAWGRKRAKAIETWGRFESFIAAAGLGIDGACGRRRCCRKTEQLSGLFFITDGEAIALHARASL